MTLGEALKQVRRTIYQYGDASRTLMLVEKPYQIKALIHEVMRNMEASSLTPKFTAADRVLTTDKGGFIRLAAVSDSIDAYAFGGSQWTRIVWLYEPQEKILGYMASLLRSPTLPTEECKMVYAEF